MFNIRRKCIAALLLGAALFLTACGGQQAETESPPASGQTPTQAPEETASLPEPVAPGLAEGDDMPTVTPSSSGTPDPTQSTQPTMDLSGPDVPAQDTPADDSYFDDAAFIGNSLMDGFRLYSGLTNCDIYAATSMTVLGVGDYITQMSQTDYGKIYILLGINEISYDSYTFKDLYAGVIDRLIEDHPDALVYIMGLTPVSKAKSDSHQYFNMERINEYNARLHELADEKDCYYIDLCAALAGEDGYLPSDVTFDGIHFTAAEYAVWLDYLRTHYIPGDADLSGGNAAMELSPVDPDLPGSEQGNGAQTHTETEADTQ